RILAGAGYEVLVAEDGSDALRLMASGAPPIDLLLTDFLMPGLTGIELARMLRSRTPELPIVFMSGFVGHDDQVERDLAAIGPVLNKPFTGRMLRSTLASALAAPRASPSKA
nr:response regulator [Gemmatimonadaceae bacterium]